MKTSVLYYSAFFLVVLSSVLFGLDWQSTPMSPMPPIKVVALSPPPVKAVSTNPAPENPVTPPSIAPIAVAPPAPVAQTPPKPQKPLCDVAACAAAYRTFRESDCSFVPSFGERRLCTKGVAPAAAAAAPDVTTIMNPEPGVSPPSNSPSQASSPAICNVSACAAAFRSFTASDCTYQPTDGPRRLCAK